MKLLLTVLIVALFVVGFWGSDSTVDAQSDLPFCVMTTLNSGTDPPGYQVRINSPISVTATFSEPVN